MSWYDEMVAAERSKSLTTGDWESRPTLSMMRFRIKQRTSWSLNEQFWRLSYWKFAQKNNTIRRLIHDAITLATKTSNRVLGVHCECIAGPYGDTLPRRLTENLNSGTNPYFWPFPTIEIISGGYFQEVVSAPLYCHVIQDRLNALNRLRRLGMGVSVNLLTV